MKQPIVVERFADNGEHSHWELIGDDGEVLWSEDVEYYNPPQPVYNSKLVMTPRLYEEMKRRAKIMFDNQGESPERSVAENPK